LRQQTDYCVIDLGGEGEGEAFRLKGVLRVLGRKKERARCWEKQSPLHPENKGKEKSITGPQTSDQFVQGDGGYGKTGAKRPGKGNFQFCFKGEVKKKSSFL